MEETIGLIRNRDETEPTIADSCYGSFVHFDSLESKNRRAGEAEVQKPTRRNGAQRASLRCER